MISWLYVAYNGLPEVQALFYGIGPTVIAIVALSAVRLARMTVGQDKRMWFIFGFVALVTVWLHAEVATLFVVAGLIGIAFCWPRAKNTNSLHSMAVGLLPLVSGAGAAASILPQLAGFFIVAGAFTFGSGLAIVPFLHQGVVLEHHWLNERQFLDAVAVGVITPGLVVITAAFVGYLVAGFWGSLVSALAVFLPVYLMVLFIGGYIIRNRERPALKGFVKGATSAASGAIAGAAVILAQGSIVDIPTAFIGLASLLVLWRFKVPEPFLIAIAAIAGLILYRH